MKLTVLRREDGSPIAGATVRVFAGATRKASRRIAVLLTDDSGVVTIPAAEPRCWMETLAPGRSPRRWCPSMDGPPEHARVPLSAGRTLAGRIVAEDGQPLAGARITLTWIRASRNEYWPARSRRFSGSNPIASGADGRFEVLDVDWTRPSRDATLCLQVRHPGHVKGWRAGIETLAAGDDHVIVADVVLARGRSLRGTVLDPSGRGVAGLHIHVTTPAWAGSVRGNTRLTHTDAAGRFTVGGLPAAAVEVGIWDAPDGQRHGRAERVDLSNGDIDDLRIRGLDFVPRRIRALEGRLLRRDGTPAAREALVTYPTPCEALETDPKGRFRIRGVPEDGSLHIAGGLGRWTIALPVAAVLELHEQQTFDVEVQLVHATDGSPMAIDPVAARRHQAWVESCGANEVRETDVQPDGRVRLTALIRGPYELRAFAPGCCVAKAEFDLPELGCSEPLLLPMLRGLPVQGRVTDAGGRPVADARVHVIERGQIFRARRSRTDPEGRFAFPGLDATVSLAIQHRDHPVHAVVLDDAPMQDGARIAEIRLPAGIACHGRVTFQDGTPAAGVIVQPVAHIEGLPRWHPYAQLTTTVTAADGTYLLESLPPIPLKIDAAFESASLPAADGDTVRRDFVIARHRRIGVESD